MALEHPDQLQTGKSYMILSGHGEGETGLCVDRRENGFGHVWGAIRTPTGTYWTRSSLLEERSASEADVQVADEAEERAAQD